MIVVFGRSDDPPIALALEALRASNRPHHVIDLLRFEAAQVVIDTAGGALRGQLRAAGASVALDAVTSVYARPMPLPGGWRDAAAARAAHRANDAFVAWLDIAEALVVSRPRAMHSNASKLLQMQLIAAAGFEVPATLVTSDPAEALAFRRQHGRVIFKSCSGVRSIVRELDDAAATRLDRLGALPVQFQQRVEGVDVRVHVVGRRCFATEIRSPADDYRYARGGEAVELRAIRLPAPLAARCIKTARTLDLPLAGIDLRRRPDGTHVCFEVNPMPAYSYYESMTGARIGAALAELLARPGRATRPRRRADTPAVDATTVGRLDPEDARCSPSTT